jgi:hypothetical protein
MKLSFICRYFLFVIIDDHTVINMNTLHHGRFLTVRTLTENDGESHDSIPIDLDEILRRVINYLIVILLIHCFFCF